MWDVGLTKWPVADRMYVFVRKDIAAQVWNLGVGEGSASNPFTTVEVNQCTANWQPLEANQILTINHGRWASAQSPAPNCDQRGRTHLCGGRV